MSRELPREPLSPERQALVKEHMALARHLTRQYRRRTDGADIFQVACLGLLKAAADSVEGAPVAHFLQLAQYRIRSEVRAYLRKQKCQPGGITNLPRDREPLAANELAARDLASEAFDVVEARDSLDRMRRLRREARVRRRKRRKLEAVCEAALARLPEAQAVPPWEPPVSGI